MNFDNLKGRLTRKLGPLPLWVWALIIVGVAYGAYRFTVGRGGGTAVAYSEDAEQGSIEDTPLDIPAFDTGGSGGGISTGGGGTTTPTPSIPAEPTVVYYPEQTDPTAYDDSSMIGPGSFGIDPGYDPSIAENSTPNLYQPTTTAKPGPGSINTQRVNERLALAEQAAKEGNMAAALNYARAALPYSKTASSTQNINSIIQAYGGAASTPAAARAPAPRAAAKPAAKKAIAKPVAKATPKAKKK